ITLRHGKGKIVWSPLPVEVSDSVEPTVALYEFATREAGVSSKFSVGKRNPSILILPTLLKETALYTLVSECDRDTDLEVIHRESNAGFSISVPAQRAAIVFVRRSHGTVLSK